MKNRGRQEFEINEYYMRREGKKEREEMGKRYYE
jgi:hypothetical protein